ncbi:hypothetical protein BBJ28_00022709 [Nothophytophthora sp. Chile5]|nr:hypothetical protein BBJ28_00022709 [Nothophytophthora sp. Chile5]
MKEYVRRQLRYWVDDFRDDLLPRDFASKSFTRTQLALPGIRLKPDRVTTLLHLPPPLLVTRAQCTEVTIAVPSWSESDKAASQKPVLIHVTELLICVKNVWECGPKARRAAEARAQAALLEPDPLGSIASMYDFAREVSERIKIMVDNVRVSLFVGGVSRVQMTLADLHARTTDALWQDVGDLTTSVDASPDNLVQTRFKCVSFTLSMGMTAPGSVPNSASSHSETIHLLEEKVPVVVRTTRFYHRQALEDAWRKHLQLIDVNFGTLRMEYGIADLLEVYTVVSTLCSWFLGSGDSEIASRTSVDMLATDRAPSATSNPDEAVRIEPASIALQITFRGTIEAVLKFMSTTEGMQDLCLTANHAAGNIIIHHNGTRELQVSVHELAMAFRRSVVFRLKPDREVLQIELRRDSVFVKWRVQSVLCQVDDDLAAILTEIYGFMMEKEQEIIISCGACHQKINLEMIDAHVCPPRGSKSLPSSPVANQASRTDSRRNSFSESSFAESLSLDVDQNGPRFGTTVGSKRLRISLHMDELELQIGRQLANTMLQLSGGKGESSSIDREVTAKLTNLRLTTESNEFAGDAIFVPVLPLAFQMLECSLQGCGCILKRKEQASEDFSSLFQTRGMDRLRGWPSRLFLDVSHCSVTAQECFVTAEKIQVRSSFSDGSRVCASSQPQLSFHVNVDRIRSQLDEPLFQLARSVFGESSKAPSGGMSSTMLALFLGVIQIRAVEFTLQNPVSTDARTKTLLKQAILVFDNQLGFLCTQSSLDFKSIFNSPQMRFVHRQFPMAGPIAKVPQALPQNTLSSDTTVNQPRTATNSNGDAIQLQDAAPADTDEIQLKIPSLTDTDEPQALNMSQRESDQTQSQSAILPEGGQIQHPSEMESKPEDIPLESCPTNATIEEQSALQSDSDNMTPSRAHDLEREDACRCIQRMARRYQLVQQNRELFQPDDDEQGSVTPIEKETTRDDGESTPKVEPAPASPVRKRTLGIPSPISVLGADDDLVSVKTMTNALRGGFSKLMSPLNRTLQLTDAMKTMQSIESTAPPVQVACYSVTTTEVDAKVGEMESSRYDSRTKLQELRHGELEDRETTRSTPLSKGKRPTDPILTSGTSVSEAKVDGNAVSAAGEAGEAEEPKENGLSDTQLASLPDVVRVLVQIGECRLCVPINPREKVDYLCCEIDKHGGVFSPSDTVGFILSVAPSELFFAYPHEHHGQIRSLARLAAGSARTARSRALRSIDSSAMRDKAKGERPTRFSKLPLPLVIALLANESERDLIRLGVFDREGTATREDWPDLALNAASLDADKNPLHVEVAWHDSCIEVTNGDAFALCRRQLGLCTSRVTSKYVGKILRGRLKVDPTNPLIEWACRRKMATEAGVTGDHCARGNHQEEAPPASYEELKKAVQDAFGVYTR